MMKEIENKNPRDDSGWTPLHYAANGGHLSICKAIMSSTDEKDPPSNDGTTPSKLLLKHMGWN